MRRWVGALVVVLVAVAGCGAWLLTRGDTSQAATTAMTSTVSSQTMQQTVSASGTIAPARSADLDFAVAGTVTQVVVAEGATVSKGQAIARVGDSALVATRTAAVSALTAAEDQLAEDEDADAAATQVASDEAAVAEAKSKLTQAREAVADATLRSTIAGTVTSLGVAVGDVVGSTGSSGAASGAASSATAAASTTTTSTAAATVTSTKQFVLDATVDSTSVAQVKTGLQAQITVTGVDGTVYGTVQDIGLVAQTSDTGAAVFPVTIAVTGDRDDLYGGTSATASIIVSQTDGVLTVPSQALQSDGGTTYVDKVVDGKAVKTTVVTGTTYGQATAVVSGLAEGDVVQLPGFTAPAGGGTTGETGQRGGPGGTPPGGGAGGFPGGDQAPQ